jgi:cell division protein FtsB
VTATRLVALLVLLAAAYFALQGGEYSTLQWRELKRSEKEERAAVQALAREVDSLRRVERLVLTDPGTQERIARVQYGMLRKGEREVTLVRPEEK